jgi:hypothetical protein
MRGSVSALACAAQLCPGGQEASAAGEGKPGAPAVWARWEQVKLQRAEWALPRTVPGHYSRVLYLSNLKPARAPTLIYTVIDHYLRVSCLLNKLRPARAQAARPRRRVRPLPSRS